MWIGSIRLVVRTGNARDAGTDNLVTATILRDGETLATLALDYPKENDLERGALRNYDYIGPTKLPRRNDKTAERQPGMELKGPMPFPEYGFEYSNGLKGHLQIRLSIGGGDLWIKDAVDLHVRFIRLNGGAWQEDADWTLIERWGQDVRMSTQKDIPRHKPFPNEGVTPWILVV
jgi:hypothetical protein